MIESEYYNKYRGPNLVKCILNEDDITNQIKPFYGSNNNWNGKLYTYKEIFGNDSINKKFRLDFKSDDGREHWFHGFIHDIYQYMNPPLATPFNIYYNKNL
jgi:hypothetical protein